ncbi:hypothetical protein [Ensifer sp. SL37]|uniref:hypothetical protein n=1 Tax=Ensifer sp. SL37 TaxID=2995137 RepID=UPI002275324C|nr:hypothetical protein [Ensifer sp. SL37]MCY1740875.1 hypothetical protein [Ensifer sp. SL37]
MRAVIGRGAVSAPKSKTLAVIDPLASTDLRVTDELTIFTGLTVNVEVEMTAMNVLSSSQGF